MSWRDAVRRAIAGYAEQGSMIKSRIRQFDAMNLLDLDVTCPLRRLRVPVPCLPLVRRICTSQGIC